MSLDSGSWVNFVPMQWRITELESKFVKDGGIAGRLEAKYIENHWCSWCLVRAVGAGTDPAVLCSFHCPPLPHLWSILSGSVEAPTTETDLVGTHILVTVSTAPPASHGVGEERRA